MRRGERLRASDPASAATTSASRCHHSQIDAAAVEMAGDVLDQCLGELDEAGALDLARPSRRRCPRPSPRRSRDFEAKFEARRARACWASAFTSCADHREAAPGLARAGGLDRGVEREQIGARGDFLARSLAIAVGFLAEDRQKGSNPAWHVSADKTAALVNGPWSISAAQQSSGLPELQRHPVALADRRHTSPGRHP